MRLSLLVLGVAFAAAGCAAPATVEVASPDDRADTPTSSVGLEPRGDAVDQLVANGVVGLDLAEQAPADAFHAAMLVGPGNYAWYMTEAGWTERIPTDSPRQDALCRWAVDLGLDREGSVDADFNSAVNEASIREYSDLLGSDGLPLVIADVCGHGTRAQRSQPVPDGSSQYWDDVDEDSNPCWLYDEDEDEDELEDCRRHYGTDADYEQ